MTGRRRFAVLRSSVTWTFVKVTALIGYARVSKADGSQVVDLQRDALAKAGVDLEHHLYSDTASGKRDDRPGLEACIKALRHGDTLVMWKLDRLGRDLRHLVDLVGELIVERTKAGLAAARARGRTGGRPVKMTPAKLREDGRRLIDLRKRRQPAREPTNT